MRPMYIMVRSCSLWIIGKISSVVNVICGNMVDNSKCLVDVSKVIINESIVYYFNILVFIILTT